VLKGRPRPHHDCGSTCFSKRFDFLSTSSTVAVDSLSNETFLSLFPSTREPTCPEPSPVLQRFPLAFSLLLLTTNAHPSALHTLIKNPLSFHPLIRTASLSLSLFNPPQQNPHSFTKKKVIQPPHVPPFEKSPMLIFFRNLDISHGRLYRSTIEEVHRDR